MCRHHSVGKANSTAARGRRGGGGGGVVEGRYGQRGFELRTTRNREKTKMIGS